MKVVNWEETEAQVIEEPDPSPVAAFLLHVGGRCSASSGVDRYHVCPCSGWIPLV